jgi:hypothetical protein
MDGSADLFVKVNVRWLKEPLLIVIRRRHVEEGEEGGREGGREGGKETHIKRGTK